jgi:C4-type Zn-finger protein
MMMQRPLSPIRHCPVCGIAMQASKSHESLPTFDTFRCMNCNTAIRETTPQPSPGSSTEPTES